jgi:HEAT repeat protein
MGRNRFLLAAVLLLPALPSAVQAQGGDPVVRDRKLSEWLVDLRGEKDVRTRLVAPMVLGAPGTHPNLWLAQTNRRKAGLLAAELAGSEHRPVLPAIIEALRDDPDDSLRAAAALTLGRLAARPKADPELFITPTSALLGALKNDRAARVREASAEALGRMTAVPGVVLDVVPALAAALKDPAPEPRRGAAEALRRWGKAAQPALEALQETLRSADNSPATRVLAARAITAVGHPEAVAALPALKEVVSDARAPVDVRVAAAETIGALGPDVAAVAPLLGELLGSAETPTPLRQELAATLGKFGPGAKPAVPALKKAARDPDKYVRTHALYAFSKIGKDLGDEVGPVTKLLLESLSDPMLEVRLAAIETLGRLGPDTLGGNAEEVRRRLMEYTKDPIQEVRDAAEAALVRLRPAPSP